MKKVKTISSALGISAFIVALSIGSYISPLYCQAATEAGNETANKFDGTYNSAVENNPALNGTMVIDGLAVSYCCPAGDCRVSDTQFTRNTILFRLTCGATTYTFVGIYSLDGNGRNHFRGVVESGAGNAAKSPLSPSMLSPSSGPGARRSVMDDDDTWQATAIP